MKYHTFLNITELAAEPIPAKSKIEFLIKVFMSKTDEKMQVDYPISDVDKILVISYRKYLRDFNKQENWLDKEVLTYDEWLLDKQENSTLLDIVKETQTIIVNAVQNKLDEVARTKNYDNGFALASYSNSSDPIFKKEANAYIVWRDKCWRYCYDLLGSFIPGVSKIPSVDEVLNGLPQIDWDLEV